MSAQIKSKELADKAVREFSPHIELMRLMTCIYPELWLKGFP